MREETASSLRDIEDVVASVFGGKDTCFRGQSSAKWDLVPSAYRAFVSHASASDFDPTGWAGEVERDTYRSFEMEADSELRGLDMLERISRAQHHGVPTRMLDWTSNVAIATYFAVAPRSTDVAAVWALNLAAGDFPFPPDLGRQHRGGGFRLDNIAQYGLGFRASFAQPVSKPIVFGDASDGDGEQADSKPRGTFIVWKPHRVDERLKRQEGLLSWYHSFDDFDLVWNYSDHIRELEGATGKELILKITIDASVREDVLEQVLNRGLNEHFLFADLDGVWFPY